MKRFYLTSTDMLEPSPPLHRAGALVLLIDGKLVGFPGGRWGWEAQPAPGWVLWTIEWQPNFEQWQEAFETTLGVIPLPLPWDTTTPAPPAALAFLADALPLAIKQAVTPLTFAQVRDALPVFWQNRLLPW